MTWVPTLADAEEWCRQKDARNSWADICIASREIMDREWKKTPEYKTALKAHRLQERQRKVRAALEREAREKREAEIENERLAEKAKHEAWKAKQKQYEIRSRRSRIDWSELLDNPVTVERQVQWERQTTALAMRQAGLTYRAIGARMGLSGDGAQRLVHRAGRCRRKPGAVSPAEAFMNAELHKEVQDFAQMQRRLAIKPFQYPKIDCLLLANGG